MSAGLVLPVGYSKCVQFLGWVVVSWFYCGFWFLVGPTSGGDLGWAPLVQAMILSWRGMIPVLCADLVYHA